MSFILVVSLSSGKSVSIFLVCLTDQFLLIWVWEVASLLVLIEELLLLMFLLVSLDGLWADSKEIVEAVACKDEETRQEELNGHGFILHISEEEAISLDQQIHGSPET